MAWSFLSSLPQRTRFTEIMQHPQVSLQYGCYGCIFGVPCCAEHPEVVMSYRPFLIVPITNQPTGPPWLRSDEVPSISKNTNPTDTNRGAGIFAHLPQRLDPKVGSLKMAYQKSSVLSTFTNENCQNLGTGFSSTMDVMLQILAKIQKNY